MGIWDKEKKELEKLWGATKGKNGMLRTTEQFLRMNTFEHEDTGDVLVNLPPITCKTCPVVATPACDKNIPCCSCGERDDCNCYQPCPRHL